MMIIVLSSVFAAIVLAVLLVGNYFVSFALKGGSDFDPSVVPASENDGNAAERKRIASENGRMLSANAEQWAAKVKIEDASTTSFDGLALRGLLYMADPESHRYAISMHGYKDRKERMTTYAAFFGKRGINTLAPDQRAHGQSEGKYISMGWFERMDVVAWARYILERDSQARILIHGVSMGGATTMMAAGENPPGVVAAIEDCGYTSVWDIFADEMRSIYHIPPFPVLDASSLLARIRAGFSFRKASSLKQLEKTELPMLFVHGGADSFVGTYMLDECFAAHKGTKRKLLVPDAGHAEAYARDPELFERTVGAFLDKFFPPTNAGNLSSGRPS